MPATPEAPPMSRLTRCLIFGLALCAALPATAHAQVADDFATLPYLAETDPDAALDRITELTARPDPDPRSLYDLYRMAADLMIEGGWAEQAAQAIAKLADFAVLNRDFLGFDPLPVYAEAAALLRDTGQTEAARDTLLAMYEEQRLTGAPPQALSRTARDIAELSEAMGEAVPDLAAPLDPGSFSTISVYYATDRAISGELAAPLYYGADGGEPEVGRATVSRPTLPGPLDYSKLREVSPEPRTAWRDRLNADPAPGRLIYVHGAATPFEQAARQAAFLAQALGGVEVPILYSWPASGSTLDYMADSAATRRSARHLAELLRQLTAKPGAVRPHLVARGMGAQVLADALELVAAGRTPEVPPPFGQLILVAPDMDAERLHDLLPALRPLVQRVTLYASENDEQMVLARSLYGHALRAGWGGEATFADDLADSIDVAASGPGLLAAPAVLSDMAMLIWRDAAPERRCGLQPALGGEGAQTVWRIGEGICSDPALVATLAHLRQAGVETPDQAAGAMRAADVDPDLSAALMPVIARLLGL